MTPSLVPDLAQLETLLAAALVALLTIGIGLCTGARRGETAFVAGWGVASLVTVLAGTLGGVGLSRVMMALALAGVAGLVWAATSGLRSARPPRFAMLGRVAALAVPLVAGTASIVTIGWDDFSHWMPNFAYICIHDHFPTLAEPSGSGYAAYPYALALPGFAIFLITGRVADDAALFWNLAAMLCAAASIGSILATRLQSLYAEPARPAALPWIAAAIGLLFAGLACPSFVAKIFFSNMADAATGAVLAVLVAMLPDWIDARRRRDRLAVALTFGLGCAALVDLRQANAAQFGLLILGCAIVAWRHRDLMRSAAWPSLLVAVVLPTCLLLSWGSYTASQIPAGEYHIMPLADWRWSLLPQTLHSIVRIMIAKTGLFALIFFISIRAVLALRARDTLTPSARGVAIVTAVVSAGMIGFLTFTYLAASFSAGEAVAAASFWRYMGEVGPAVMVAVLAVLPLGWLKRMPSRPTAAALLGVTLVLPLATVRLYRADLASPVPWLHAVARSVDAQVPRSASLTLLDITGNGFPVLILNYDLALSAKAPGLPPRTVTRRADVTGISGAKAAQFRFDDAAYVWLAEGDADATSLFGTALHRKCSYLLRHEAGRFNVVARWPIGYAWSLSNGQPGEPQGCD